MADPVSILAIVNGSIGLALKVGTVVKELYNLSQRLKYAELTIQSIASECETIQAAWEGIQAWAERQPTEYDEGRQRLFDRLNRSLLFGTMVFSRSKIVWNEGTFAQHQDRIRGQVAAMTLLLQVIDLPTSTEQTALLIQNDGILVKSDESAWTIVDSSGSYSNKHPGSRSSMESEDTIYVKFDFEPELLSGRVYGRSYNYLARNLVKARGKEVARDVRAQLFVRGNAQSSNEERMSIFSVSLNLELIDYEDQKHTEPNLPKSPLPTGPAWGMVNSRLSRSRNISLQPPTSQRVETIDQAAIQDLDIEKLYWVIAQYRVAPVRMIVRPKFKIKIQQNQTSVYRTYDTATKSVLSPKWTGDFPWIAKPDKPTLGSDAYFVLSVKVNQKKAFRRLILDIDMVAMQQAISTLVSAHQKPDSQPWSSLSSYKLDSGSEYALAIMDDLVQWRSEGIEDIFKDVLTYFVDRLEQSSNHELGEKGMEAVNECKDDVVAIYRNMIQSRVRE